MAVLSASARNEANKTLRFNDRQHRHGVLDLKR